MFALHIIVDKNYAITLSILHPFLYLFLTNDYLFKMPTSGNLTGGIRLRAINHYRQHSYPRVTIHRPVMG